MIRLPAAKSDIARFFLLREYGGLYVDAHVGPTDPAKLVNTLEKLSNYNLIVFGMGWEMKQETDWNLMNGVVAGRRNAPELTLIINRILRNVTTLKTKEDNTSEYVHYHLWSETGTHVLILELFDQVQPRPRVKDRFRNTVFAHYMKNNHDSGFSISSHNNYQQQDNHWSKRERSERFFLDPKPVFEDAKTIEKMLHGGDEGRY